MPESHLQEHLKSLIETVEESWTYAIFWRFSYDHYSGSSVLNFDNGYYNGKGEAKATLTAEQIIRKQVRISGLSATIMEEEITDAEWFFKISMAQSFEINVDLPGHAFFSPNPVWITGANQLSASTYERAKWGQEFGLQTMVCIPSKKGVLELGSTELIFQNSECLRNMVRVFLERVVPPDGVLKQSGLSLNAENLPERADDEIQNTQAIGRQREIHSWLNITVSPDNDSDRRLSLIAESLPERADDEIQNRGHKTLHKQLAGQEKISDLKCSWPLLTDSSDKGCDRRSYSYSNSNEYSGPSRIFHI